MIASDYLQLEKRLYQNRRFPEAVMKKRYEKAFDKFGTPEKRKEDRKTLDELIAKKKEDMQKEIAEIEARKVLEYDFHLMDEEEELEELDYGWER